jgi:ketosteroid isomerase-like protein
MQEKGHLIMKRLMTTLLTVALGAGISLAQAQPKDSDAKKPAASASAVADELKQIEQDWADAMKAKNADKLSDIIADSWVGLGWDGKTSNKAKIMADLKAPGNSLDSYDLGPVKVRTFGNTAVVTGSDTEKSTDSGKDTSGKYIWTDVFVKQNGKWKAVASQSTKVPK